MCVGSCGYEGCGQYRKRNARPSSEDCVISIPVKDKEFFIILILISLFDFQSYTAKSLRYTEEHSISVQMCID